MRITLWEELMNPGTLGVLGGLGLFSLIIPALLAVGIFTGILRIIELAKRLKNTH